MSMECRLIDNLGIQPSLLGFGCMRFPVRNGKIDESEAEKMLDKAIAEGVTYIDTAFPYHNGDSEPFVGKVLKKYDRNSFYLATKLPVWDVHTLDDAKRIFQNQLERLQTDYIDFYLLHAMNKERWDEMNALGVVDYLDQLKEQGKIKYLGFSFHDEYPTFDEMIHARKWDFCQIQLNYMDTDIQAGIKGYLDATELGVPVVIMEPIKGGSLTHFSDEIQELFLDSDPDASIASWALRWVGSLPNVKVILSGMSTMDQLDDNLKTFQNFKPLSEVEQNVVDQVVSEVKKRTKNGCTGCRYCMPCPFGVDIPRNFHLWNEFSMYQNKNHAKWEYSEPMKKVNASFCKQCGACEKMCPQSIPIRSHLSSMAEEFQLL